MAERGFYLTERERLLVREVVAQVRRSSGTLMADRGIDDQDIFAPETYLAHTPHGGIPALNNQGTTGTGRDAEDDVIGSAVCDLYRAIQVGPTWRPSYLGIQRTVFNVSPVAIAGWKWVLVHRDKFGQWYVPTIGLDFTTC